MHDREILRRKEKRRLRANFTEEIRDSTRKKRHPRLEGWRLNFTKTLVIVIDTRVNKTLKYIPLDSRNIVIIL